MTNADCHTHFLWYDCEECSISIKLIASILQINLKKCLYYYLHYILIKYFDSHQVGPIIINMIKPNEDLSIKVNLMFIYLFEELMH